MDTVLGVVQGLVTSAMALIGVYMTLHPPETVRAKRGYKASFLLLAVVSIFVTVMQTTQSSASQQRIEGLLTELKRQAERPIEVTAKLAPGPSPTPAPSLGATLPARAHLRFVQRETQRRDDDNPFWTYQVTVETDRVLLSPVLTFTFDRPVHQFGLDEYWAIDKANRWISDRVVETRVPRLSFRPEQPIGASFMSAERARVLSVRYRE
jgi:hypothetical protein